MSSQIEPVEKPRLEELLDVPAFQDLLESFSRLTGLSTAILDLDGKVLAQSGWQEICKQFHRQHPQTLARCLESDTILANQLSQEKTYHVYECKNGLVDVAVPIVVDNFHAGNLFTGQFFFQQPDITHFSRQAAEFGFDKKTYLNLLEKVPIISEEKIETAMDFLADLTGIIGSAAIDKKRLININIDLEQKIEKRTREIQTERTFSDSLIKSLPGIMYLIDRLGHFGRWNSNFETITGYSAEQIRSMNPLDFFSSSDDQQHVAQAMDQVFKQGAAKVEADLTTIDGKQIPYLFTGYRFIQNNIPYLIGVGLDISERVRSEKEKEVLINKLREMLSKVKQLSGFIPICASCKKIRNDKGFWSQLEEYISQHSEAEFSHSLCPECVQKLYPNLFDDDELKAF